MKKLGLLLILSTLGCKQSSPAENPPVLESARVDQAITALSNYPTGQQLLQKINSFKNTTGKRIQFQFRNPGDMQAAVVRGDYEASIQNTSDGYTISIQSGLSHALLTHVIAHEYQHILDDSEVEQVLLHRPDITSLAQRTLSEMQAGRIHQLNQSHVDYVLGSVFCAESRAYSINRRLIQEGLPEQKMAEVTMNLGQHIDHSYIRQNGTSYSTNSNSMVQWCLGFSSMAQIQYNLINDIN